MSSGGTPSTFFARISKQTAYVRHFDNDINPKDLFRFIQVELPDAPHFRVRITFLAGFCLFYEDSLPSEPAPAPCVFNSILTEGSTVGWALQLGSGHSQPIGHKAYFGECRLSGTGPDIGSLADQSWTQIVAIRRERHDFPLHARSRTWPTSGFYKVLLLSIGALSHA